MYTTFSGSKDASAARWLHTLEHQVRGPNPNYNLEYLPPRMWLTCINGLLVGDAALWADHHPRTRRILAADNLASASQKDVETFKTAFLARFPPARMTADLCRSSLSGEPQTFAQGEFEDIDSYYERALILLHDKGGVDFAEAPLTDSEEAALNAMILIYIEGLLDKKIHEDIESAWIECEDEMGLLDVHYLAKSQTVKSRLHVEQKLSDHTNFSPDIENPEEMSNYPIDDDHTMQSPDKAGPISRLNPFSGLAGTPSSHSTDSQAMSSQGATTEAASHHLNHSNPFEPAPETAKENNISDLPTWSESEQNHIPTRPSTPHQCYPIPSLPIPATFLFQEISTLKPLTAALPVNSHQHQTPTPTPASTISTNIDPNPKHDADDTTANKHSPTQAPKTPQPPPSNPLFFF